MKDNFINQHDPTKPLEDVSLETQYTKLSEDEKLKVFCKIKGFSHLPPSIERLYSDPFYLGSPLFFNHGDSIFQFWKDKLHEIAPSPVLNKYPLTIRWIKIIMNCWNIFREKSARKFTNNFFNDYVLFYYDIVLI